MLTYLTKKLQFILPIEFTRYCLVGALAFAVDICMLYFLTEFCGVYYLFSSAFGFIFGLITNYLLSVHWVFSTRSIKNKTHEFFMFAMIGLVGLAITVTTLWFLTEKLKVYYIFSKVIVTILTLLWNYLARKKVLFK